ncbi:MAG: hypothetical protein R2711_15075 [Acidimicrobiales bacterium]
MYRSNGHGGGVLAGDVTKTYVLTTDHGLPQRLAPVPPQRRTGTWRRPRSWIPFDCPADFIRQQVRTSSAAPDASSTTYWTSRLHNGTSGSSTIRSFVG